MRFFELESAYDTRQKCPLRSAGEILGQRWPLQRLGHATLVWLTAAGLCLMPAAPSLHAQSDPAQATAQAPAPTGIGEGSTQVRIPPPPTEPTSANVLQSTSEVVRIDIQVMDKNGKTIKGLKPDQFTITDDGKAQKISTFSFEDIEAIQTAENSTTRGPSLYP